jgi:hypothetical protein
VIKKNYSLFFSKQRKRPILKNNNIANKIKRMENTINQANYIYHSIDKINTAKVSNKPNTVCDLDVKSLTFTQLLDFLNFYKEAKNTLKMYENIVSVDKESLENIKNTVLNVTYFVVEGLKNLIKNTDIKHKEDTINLSSILRDFEDSLKAVVEFDDLYKIVNLILRRYLSIKLKVDTSFYEAYKPEDTFLKDYRYYNFNHGSNIPMSELFENYYELLKKDLKISGGSNTIANV